MSKRINDVAVIAVEPEMICSECGAIAEVRPYGHNGAEICYRCGEKIPDVVMHNMKIKLFGEKGNLR